MRAPHQTGALPAIWAARADGCGGRPAQPSKRFENRKSLIGKVFNSVLLPGDCGNFFSITLYRMVRAGL
jgi:hypothetical protein